MPTFSRTKKTHRSGSECRGHQNEDVGGGARHRRKLNALQISMALYVGEIPAHRYPWRCFLW